MNEQLKLHSVRILPDPQICRAAELTELYAECLVEKSGVCEYAMPFGYGYLCGHLDRKTIIANTSNSREQNGASKQSF